MDTLDRICNTKELYDMFSFMTDDQQQRLFEYLKDKDPELYAGLDTTKKSIIVRVTGSSIY